MCGLAGILAHHGPPPSLDALGRMAGALHHRGPDESGIYRDAWCGLAHTRLSIVDIAAGQQPMTDDRDELVVVFNGEIFNHAALRDELRRGGAQFRTRCDTEVVAVALRTWGEAALARFEGQFAIAAWWPRPRALLVARDRFGVRPLHLCEHGGRIYFASEVKAIFAADPSIPRALDPTGLAETFTFWTVVAPRTCFRGVEELRPAHVRVYTPDGTSERCYWQPRFPHDGAAGYRGTIDDAAAELRAALEAATAARLQADVPVGCYVSGGLDSSMIAALARRASGRRLQTFSLAFADSEYDESRFQRELVARLETEHREIVVSRDAIAQALPDVIRHVERPLLRTGPAPLFLLARLVREAGLKVVLTGEGADELLAGYDLFREARIRRFWAREPASRQRPRLLERLYPYLARSPAAARAMALEFFALDLAHAHAPTFAHGPRWRSARALQRVFASDLRAEIAHTGDVVERLIASFPAELADWDPLARDQYVEIRTLLSGYLLASQGDRVAMASSVEARFPFLDTRVVELASSLPAGYKLRVLDEKHVLKRAAAGLVMRDIIERPKQPYRAPDALAFCGERAPEWIRDELSPAAISACGVFDPACVAQLWSKCRARGDGQLSNADNMALTGILSTQLLHRQLIRSRPCDALAAPPRTVIDRL
ncbi:MAG TPA: asparagine synthase (glutamine-hydrolyzing) [Kofleriaceae bacterium]|nr:asparagine synthase (glutamine-hydrolyzing) [Kofleriaceae bacterium]